MYSYIQSRFYRAPEIILGIPYTPSIDVWSFGCILVELYTGLPIFPAEDEKELISCIAEVIGEPSSEFIALGSRSSGYFNPDGSLKPHKNSRGRKRISNTRPIKIIMKGAEDELVRLISECLRWDPKERINAERALLSSWFLGNASLSKVHSRQSKVSMEDVIKYSGQGKKFVTHRIKPSMP